jgi:hypothetical protein
MRPMHRALCHFAAGLHGRWTGSARGL